MNFLLDTHLLLWAAKGSKRIPKKTLKLLKSQDNALFFSPVSFWEIAIKNGMGRDDFKVDIRVLRRALLDNDYQEIDINSNHSIMIETLPPIHKDPFDRMLIAQATFEGITLLTSDSIVAQYPGPIQKV